MATIGNEMMTLSDRAKLLDPDGSIAEIIEVLEQSNPLLMDAVASEGNLPTGHRYTQRSGLPEVYWRAINQGVPKSKGKTVQVTDAAGMIEGFSKVDVALADLNGNAAAFRAGEDNGFVQAFNNKAASSIIYENASINGERMTGLSPRYSKVSADVFDAGYNIVDGGGSGDDNTSIWLVTWGPQTTHLIYPKGSVAGLQTNDLGKDLVEDDEGNEFLAYVTHFRWDLGLATPDWRYNVRIPNIDVSDLTADMSAGADLVDLMIDAYYLRPTADLGNMARAVWYCNKTVAKFLHKQARKEDNVDLSIDMVEGKPIVSLLGAPIRVCDAILNTEEAVS